MPQRSRDMNTAFELTSRSDSGQPTDNLWQSGTPSPPEEQQIEESQWGISQHLTPRSVVAGDLLTSSIFI